MAAHMGTAVQIAARGPQDALLTGPRSLFDQRVQDCATFTEGAVEVPPLRALAFGKTAVFPLPRGRDLLGDMFLEVRLPALQEPLGTDLPPQPPPEGAYAEAAVPPPLDSVMLAAPLDGGGEARVSLDRLTLQPVAGLRRAGPGWTWFRFAWPDGVRWDAVVDAASGTLRSTLTGGPGAQACKVSAWAAWPELPGWRPAAGWAQAVGRGAAVRFTRAGVAVANARWPDRLALVLMQAARLVAGDVTVHRHERLWYDLVDRLRLPDAHAAGMASMLGRGLSAGRAHTLYLPLKFFCCRDGRAARAFLPALLLSEQAPLRVELDVAAAELCAPPGVAPPASLDASLVVCAYDLQPHQRAAWLHGGQATEILVEDAQDCDGYNYVPLADGAGVATRPDVRVQLHEVNLPTKYLQWVAYEDGGPLFSYVPDAVERATLYFDSNEREHGAGAWFAGGQHPWARAARMDAARDVGLYSFALRPAELQPSGAADLSAFSEPVFAAWLRPELAARQLHLKVFAATYNVLRFRDGRATFRVVQ